MSGTGEAISYDLGGERQGNSRRSTGSNGGGGRHSHKRESSGTMQLLDRLGYGLVSGSSSPDVSAGERIEENIGQDLQEGVDYYPDHTSPKKHERYIDDELYLAQVNGTGFSPPLAGMYDMFDVLLVVVQPHQSFLRSVKHICILHACYHVSPKHKTGQEPTQAFLQLVSIQSSFLGLARSRCGIAGKRMSGVQSLVRRSVFY